MFYLPVAQWTTECLSQSKQLTSAFLPSRNLMSCLFPAMTARWRGVYPSSSLASTRSGAAAVIKSAHASAAFSAQQWSAVFMVRSRSLTALGCNTSRQVQILFLFQLQQAYIGLQPNEWSKILLRWSGNMERRGEGTILNRI